MSDYDLDAWPDTLRELADIIGPETALRLAYHYGGLERVYIPREPTANHPWTQILSPTQWQKVVHAWGGQRIDLPRGTYIQVAKRQIIALAEQGVSHRQISLRVRISERHVRRVLQGLRFEAVDPRQTKLPF